MRHTLLFTGHMIDAADRERPRFPQALESAVREAMRAELMEVQKSAGPCLRGIAGGASGGDIIFHELCLDLEIPTEICLALPRNEFKKKSVAFAGKQWEKRFDDLCEKLPVHVLRDIGDNEKNVWEACNDWMLKEASKDSGNAMLLMALWDKQGGDGEGGTEQMVKEARRLGAQVKIIDISKL